MPHEKSTPSVPYGYCHCGCGRKTRLAPQTNTARGWIKGEPLRYINQHGKRVRTYTVDPETGCWNWDSPRYGLGYVNVTEDGRTVGAHRYMYEKIKGPIPEGMVLDHLCRNPHCVNPNHLEPVTNRENIRRGERTKITRDIAAKIKAMLPDHRPIEIARALGISVDIVQNIKGGLAWRDVEPA